MSKISLSFIGVAYPFKFLTPSFTTQNPYLHVLGVFAQAHNNLLISRLSNLQSAELMKREELKGSDFDESIQNLLERSTKLKSVGLDAGDKKDFMKFFKGK